MWWKRSLGRICVVVGFGMCVALTATVGTAPPVTAQSVVHVDEAASGANDGSSWVDAFTDLQAALAVVVAGDEIRVAEGTYTPHTSDRTVSFGLVDGVTMTGGYAAGGVAGPDPDLYETVLSGDLAGDDLPGFVNNGENSYHVVTGDASVTAATVLDGFTISGGHAEGPAGGPGYFNVGGGLYVADGSPSLTDLTITGNRADCCGAGIFARRSSSSITFSTITGNTATGRGGGLYNDDGTLTLTASTISDNVSEWQGGGVFARGAAPSIITTTISGNHASVEGGGIYNETSLDVTNSDISANTAGVDGGAIFNAEESGAAITNSTITENAAGASGGAIYHDGTCFLCWGGTSVANSTITENSAGSQGGGIFLNSVTTFVFAVNSIVWGNVPSEGIVAPDGSGITTVDYSDVEGWIGDGVGNIDVDPLFADAEDYRLRAGSPAIHAGDNTAVPVDVFDVDGDGDTAEPTPDLGLSERIQGPAVDMGAYETRVLLPGGFGAPEGNSGSSVFEIPISLSAPSTETIKVDYVSWPCTAWGGCGDGLATEGVDYESPVPGTLTFLPGQTTKTVPVTVYGDLDVEPAYLWGEWFLVRFLNPSPNAVLDTSFFGLGAGVIGNDDR